MKLSEQLKNASIAAGELEKHMESLNQGMNHNGLVIHQVSMELDRVKAQLAGLQMDLRKAKVISE